MIEELKTPYEISVWRDVEKEYFNGMIFYPQTIENQYPKPDLDNPIPIEYNMLKFPTIKSLKMTNNKGKNKVDTINKIEKEDDNWINKQLHSFSFNNKSQSLNEATLHFNDFQISKAEDDLVVGLGMGFSNILYKKDFYKITFKEMTYTYTTSEETITKTLSAEDAKSKFITNIIDSYIDFNTESQQEVIGHFENGSAYSSQLQNHNMYISKIDFQKMKNKIMEPIFIYFVPSTKCNPNEQDNAEDYYIFEVNYGKIYALTQFSERISFYNAAVDSLILEYIDFFDIKNEIYTGNKYYNYSLASILMNAKNIIKDTKYMIANSQKLDYLIAKNRISADNQNINYFHILEKNVPIITISNVDMFLIKSNNEEGNFIFPWEKEQWFSSKGPINNDVPMFYNFEYSEENGNIYKYSFPLFFKFESEMEKKDFVFFDPVFSLKKIQQIYFKFLIPEDCELKFDFRLLVRRHFFGYIKVKNTGNIDEDYDETWTTHVDEYGSPFSESSFAYMSSFKYLDEQKILTIGSNKMQGLNKAHSPKLTQSITGITTFTFSLYTKYFDDKVQDFVENPFLDFLNNETKIKLNRNGEWFDFLIKSKEEDSEEHIVNYICKDIHATSLGKQGFDITLSQDLFNNQGTVKELADTVLKESDWQQDRSEETGTEIILEKNEETLYKIKLYDKVTSRMGVPYTPVIFYKEKNPQSNFSIISTEGEIGEICPLLTVYIHYSDLIKEWKPGDFVPCFLENSYMNIPNFNDLQKNDNGVIDNWDNIVYFCYNGDWKPQGYDEYVFELNEYDSKYTFNENNREVTKYRSKKVVTSNITKYIPELEKYIQVYEKNGKEFYNYTDIDYITPELVSELMVNGGTENGDEGILSDEGWLTTDYSSQPLNFTSDILQKTDGDFKKLVSEGIKDGDYSAVVKGYILINGESSPVTICNTGINSNKTILKNLTFGDKFIFEVACNKNITRAEYYPRISTISYTAKGFTEEKKLTSVLKAKRLITKLPHTWIFELQIEKTLTEKELKNSQLALVFQPSKEIKIYRASLYREVLDESGYLLSPIYSLRENPNNWEAMVDESEYYNPQGAPSVPTSGIKIKNNIYNPILEKNETITSAEDLIYEYQGYDTPESLGYVAKTTNEKIRNIEASKSNRFNILQSLSEAFGCWCKFRVDHEKDGRIKLSNPPVRQEKYVSFHNFIGDLNPIGVKYGINEKGIQRTIESDSFTTKLIVQDNVNQYAKNGTCTIARAKDNPSKDDTIYNLDYYIQMNLLGENVRADLNDYLNKMGKYSENLQNLIGQLTAVNTTKINAEADFTTWEGMVNESSQELVDLKSDFLEIYGYSTDYLKITTSNWPDGIYKDKNLGAFVDGFKEDFINILTLEAKLGNPSDGSISATGYYLELQNAKIALGNAENEYENILLELDIISNSRKSITKDFNQKYGLYLQEGTWSSDNYIDDDLYYLDALQTLALSAKPKISYEISAIDLRSQEGYEAYNYAIGNRTTIEDTEFFGWTLKENNGEFIRTPYKEDIVMSEISTFLDDASQDTITVQNYREQFEDLFQKMSAETQELQFKEGSYDNAAGAVGSNGQILPDAITNTFNNASFIIKHSGQQGLVWDDNGITITDQGNKAKIVRIAGGAIKVSSDGNTWHTAIDGSGIKANVITTGTLNISNQLNIKSGDNNAFTWNSNGISAYLYANDKLYLNDKITFNQYGLFGGLGEGTNLSTDFIEQLTNIHKNSRFALTWKGFSLKTGHANSTGYVSIDSEDDITLNVKPNNSNDYLKIIQIGHLDAISSSSTSDASESAEPTSESNEVEHYGIRIKDMNGDIILDTTEERVNGRFHINCGTW